jgi:hypothetical protein
MNSTVMRSFFSSSKNKKQKTSTGGAVAFLEGTDAETEAHSNNDDNDNDNDNDDTFQNQRQGALKLPATKLKKTTLNTCLQDHAATQLPRIDTNGHLFTAFGKGTASVDRGHRCLVSTEQPGFSSASCFKCVCKGLRACGPNNKWRRR